MMYKGVVEDIKDPREMGRVKVRVFGVHSEDLQDVPTEALPWALVMTPVTNAAMTGIGRSPTGIVQGAWVVVFFDDPDYKQNPIVIGTIPSTNSGRNPNYGFRDPEGVFPHREGKIDNPVESSSEYQESNSFIGKNDTRQTAIEIATKPFLSKIDITAFQGDRSTWDQLDPNLVTNPTYPDNQAMHTKSGHVIEVDDTLGNERINIYHTSGSFMEMDANGNVNYVARGNRYNVTFGDDFTYVKGSVNLTVDGDVRQLVKGDYVLEVEGDYNENIKGSRKSKVGGSELKEIVSEYVESIGASYYSNIGADQVKFVNGNLQDEVYGTTALVRGMGVQENYLDVKQTIISGECQFTVNAPLKVKSISFNQGVIGDLITTVSGDVRLSSSGNMDLNTVGDFGMLAQGAFNVVGKTTGNFGFESSAEINSNSIALKPNGRNAFVGTNKIAVNDDLDSGGDRLIIP